MSLSVVVDDVVFAADEVVVVAVAIAVVVDAIMLLSMLLLMMLLMCKYKRTRHEKWRVVIKKLYFLFLKIIWLTNEAIFCSNSFIFRV